ncbi:MAG: DsbA family protein [Pleurocapsa sp. SU_196_0]|nr:DsbA family protein [Pleurocapsa sp. SU_196_0]
MTPTARNAFLVALVIVAVIGVGLIFVNRPQSTSAAITDPDSRVVTYSVDGQTQTVTLVKLSSDPFEGARFVSGAEDAPVKIVEFADYQCPGCAFFALNVAAQFKTEFVDSGKVRLAYRDFPLQIHQNAPRAAVATACANEQGRWQAMHDILYRSQPSWNSLSDEAFKVRLEDFARQLGLTDATFSSCVSGTKFDDAIQNDLRAGEATNLTGTPTFVVNGYRVVSDRVPGIEAMRAIVAEFGVK